MVGIVLSILKRIGLKGAAYGVLAAILIGGYWYYGHSKYREGVGDTVAKYEKTYQDRLESDLSEVRAALSEAIAQREKARQRARELELDRAEYETRSEEYKDEIERLAKANKPCERVDPEYYRLFHNIYSELP